MGVYSYIKKGVISTKKPNQVIVEIKSGINNGKYPSGVLRRNLRVYVNKHKALDKFLGEADQTAFKYIIFVSAINGARKQFFYNCVDD